MTPRLHYLYELDGGGRENFVYLCSGCSCVLRVRRELRPTAELIDSLEGRCPGCGGRLEGATECRLVAAPDEWSSIDFHARSTRKRASHFRPASSLVHFALGFPPIDALLRPLAPGRLVVLAGEGASAVAELAAFRAQLPVEKGGLDSTVLFVDCGNRSDPYLFASFSKQYGVRPRDSFRRVTNCRVFTMYQLAELASRHLVPAVDDYAAQLVVVSDLLGVFNEPELDEREARRLLAAVEQGVGEAKKKALVVVTLVAPSGYAAQVEQWADTLVRLSPKDGRVRAELLKHPLKEQTTSTFIMKDMLRVTR